jgi:FkbM family methyltransferase
LLARAYTEREVVGFEPTPAVRDWGRRVAADNGLAYCFEQVAVGEAAGTAVLYLSDRTDSSNSLAAGFRPSSRRIEVLVETLDRHQELTNSSPAIVKITEHLVLRGARRILAEHRPWIFCEVLVNREPARVLTEIMDGTGYRYYQLTGDRAPVERQTITGDPSNPHPNYLLAPVEPRRAAPRASGSTRPGRRCNLPFMKRSARRHRTARHAISRDDPRFAAGVVLVLGCLAVMVLYVAAVVARTIVRPESGPLVDILALLDAGQERTLASWWTGALLLTASAAAALVGHLTATASGRSREVVAWRVLAVLLALLSLDEIVALHERGNRWTAAAIDADSVLTRLGWLLPASVVLVVSMGVLIPMFLALPRRPRNVVAAGLATSVGGAMGLEFVDVVLINAEAELRWRYLAMALEEAAEMAGILIMLLGISMAVRIVRTGGKLTISTLHAEAARDHATATPVESPEASADRSVTVTTP